MRDFLQNIEKGSEDKETLNPLRAAQEAMRPQLPKRFFDRVSAVELEDGFTVELDTRRLKTPAKQPVILPTGAAAQLLAEEWDAQKQEIDPGLMPVTRIINTAIDGIAADPQAVMEDVVKFAGTDLLCYRADAPQELVEWQNRIWDPVLDWARVAYGANFTLAEGIIHQAQPKETIALFAQALKAHADPIRIACIHTFTSLTGSAILALALAEGELSLEETWSAAHVDEDFNISKWGEDHEAQQRRLKRFAEMKAASLLFAALDKS